MITITTKGSWRQTELYLQRMSQGDLYKSLHRFGAMGVAALSAATPVDSGETARSWSYEAVARRGYFSLRWKNSHIENGVPIVILLEYGHATRTGGYVQGHDFITPAIRPVFDQISEEMRKVVK